MYLRFTLYTGLRVSAVSRIVILLLMESISSSSVVHLYFIYEKDNSKDKHINTI